MLLVGLGDIESELFCWLASKTYNNNNNKKKVLKRNKIGLKNKNFWKS